MESGERAEIKNRRDAQLNIKLYIYKGRPLLSWVNQQSMSSRSPDHEGSHGAFAQLESFPAARHSTGWVTFGFVQWKPKGETSAYWVSTDRAATTSSQSRSRKKHLGQVRMWRRGYTRTHGRWQYETYSLQRALWRELATFQMCVPFNLLKWGLNDFRRVAYKRVGTSKQRYLQKDFHWQCVSHCQKIETYLYTERRLAK